MKSPATTSATGEFLDTNILVYAFTNDPRAAQAQALLERGCATSVQALNEFTNVARRKLGMTWKEVTDAIGDIRTLCKPVVSIDVKTHADALRIAERYRLAFFNAVMVAAALRAGSAILWSEDMSDGSMIDGRLRIANPFKQGREPAAS